jgi:hypothetical protein
MGRLSDVKTKGQLRDITWTFAGGKILWGEIIGENTVVLNTYTNQGEIVEGIVSSGVSVCLLN